MAEYKDVTIQWHDEPEHHAVTVSIDAEWNELEDDEDIFFYFINEAEFEEAKNKDNDLEFWIVEEN